MTHKKEKQQQSNKDKGSFVCLFLRLCLSIKGVSLLLLPSSPSRGDPNDITPY